MISRYTHFYHLPTYLHYWHGKSSYAYALLLPVLFPLVLFAVSAIFARPAYAASLGEAEVRSWLGEPLLVRIPTVSMAGETLDASCLAVSRESEPFSLARDIRIELVNTDSAKRFVLRTNSSVNEPFIRLVVRFACAGQGVLTREYTLLLDPRPEIAPTVSAIGANAVVPAATPATTLGPTIANVAPAPSPRPPSQWLTGANNTDTLASIAEGVYPKSIKRKARYIAALRQLNPNLANMADDALLPPSIGLTLPDLKALSTTRQVLPARMARAPSNNVPITAPPLRARAASTTKIAPTKNLPARTPNPAPAQFELRLSGGEIDLTRSANVTDQQRAILREKQFLLDADDQIAQFLSLKNTVAQLEKRLNEVQLQMSTVPTMAATAPSSPATAPNAVKTTAVLTTQSWIDRIPFGWLLMGVFFLAMMLSSVIWIRRRQANQSRLYSSDAAVSHPNLSSNEQSAHIDHDHDEFSSWAKTPPAHQAQPNTTNNEFNRQQDEADDIALALLRNKINPADASTTVKRREVTLATLSADAAKTTQLPATSPLVLDLNVATSSAPDAEHVNIFDDSTAEFNLDSTSSNTVDFLIDDAGQPEIAFEQPVRKVESDDEGRVRRMQYMYERYPELKTKVVSIDNPDSVINAARLYVEESSIKTTQDRRASAGVTNSEGAQKAIELLAYALEERPQEARFWLAQFQVFRNANMGDEYSELAMKFNILFGQTDDWPLIQEIGRSMIPANPLFAPLPDSLIDMSSNKSGALTGKLKIANWLNVPSREVNKVTDMLALELRNALLNPPK
jgi:phage tail protein X